MQSLMLVVSTTLGADMRTSWCGQRPGWLLPLVGDFFKKIFFVYGWQHGRLLATGLIFISKQLCSQSHRCDQSNFFSSKSFFCIHGQHYYWCGQYNGWLWPQIWAFWQKVLLTQSSLWHVFGKMFCKHDHYCGWWYGREWWFKLFWGNFFCWHGLVVVVALAATWMDLV